MERELLIRLENTTVPDGTTARGITTNHIPVSFNDILNEYGHPRDFDMLDSIYRDELFMRNIRDLKFAVSVVKTDSSRYRNLYDVVSDTTAAVKSLKELKSHVIPTLTDLSEGVQATVVNPYRTIVTRMGLFAVCSLALVLLVIYAIAKQINIIHVQREMARIRQDMTYAMIHDMKTPAGTISMIASTMEKPEIDGRPETKAKYIRILREEADHLLKLSARILTVAKLEQKRIAFKTDETDMGETVGGIIEKFKIKAGKKVTFTMQFAHTHPLRTDREYLCEALDNLIDNSIKYSGSEVDILIGTRDTANGIAVSVRDNGFGIRAEDRGKIFDNFERGSTENPVAGHGLGLSYVAQIIKAQGGHVAVDSEEGKFTEITIVLPSKQK
jgi:two-component system phosphate regulon sensor histidine kinase PhoR